MKKINKSNILYILLGVLAVLYIVNIFGTNNLSNALVDKPIKISFILVEQKTTECENCFDPQNIIDIVDASHDIKYKTTPLKYGTALARKYIEMYDIRNLPAIVVLGDIRNEKIAGAWDSLRGRTTEDAVVIENLLPYYDIKSGTVKGVISAILLKDETCDICFDENQYVDLLRRAGMVVADVNIYDIASIEGKKIIQKYNIKKVPTVLFSPSAGDYPGFFDIWKEVGSVEKDGWLVFREVQKVNAEKYKNI